MSTALVVSRPVVSSPLHRAALWLARSVGALVEHPTEHRAGHNYEAPYGVDPTYDVASSMSAFAAFPWVRACVMAIAEDLSGLPLTVRRGRGKSAIRVDDHPILALLDNPSSVVLAQLYRMQLVVDLELTGMKYELILSASRTKMDPAALRRLHPQCTKPATNALGGIDAFIYDGGGEITRYAPGDVLYGRLPSWADGPVGMLGTGAIEALHNELTTDLALAKRTTEAAQRGRPDAIATPAQGPTNPGAMTTAQVKEAADSIERAFKARHGGVAVLRDGLDIKPLGWSPSEMEAPAQRAFTREAVLAAFGVPPTRLQLPTANYAQSTDAMVQYWQGLKAKAKMYTADWTRLARMMPGAHPEDVVEADFSGVSHLQEDRTARLGRVTTHILNGMTATSAYAYEGFEDAPIEDYLDVEVDTGGADVSAVAPTADVTSVADTALNGAQIASLLEVLAAVSSGALSEAGAIALLQVAFPTIDEEEARRIVEGAQVTETPEAEVRSLDARIVKSMMERPATEAGRVAVWKGWAEVQEQIEAQVAIASRKYLAGAARRISARVAAKVPPAPEKGMRRKDLTAAEIVALILGDESSYMRAAMGRTLVKAIERAYAMTAQAMGEDLRFDPKASPAEKFLGELITGVNKTTQDVVGVIIRRGLDQGLTAAEIAQQVAASPAAFGPARAMNIARTESTRALNAGSVGSMHDAQRNGVTVRKEWLSARDGAVRPAHAALDGQVVAVGGKFTVPMGVEGAGATAEYPGDFSSAAQVCNCRCTVLPVLD